MLRTFLGAWLCLAVATSAWSEAPSIDIDYEQALGLAARWILEDQLEPARRLLAGLESTRPDDPEVQFLRAQLEFALGNHMEAVAIYRRLLSANPDGLRLRLALAHALFAAQDFEAARYHFELALGQTLDEQVRESVYRYLRAIRARSPWLRFSAMFGVDSNPGYATDARSINLYGLPFILAPDARARESFGAVIQAQGRHVFGEDNRLFVHGNAELREYEGRYADLSALELSLGRNMIAGRDVWTVEAGPAGASYQDRALYDGAHARLSNARPIGERWLSSSYLSVRRLRYQDASPFTGNQYWGATTLRYALGSTTGIWASVGLGRNVAQEPAYSYRGVEGALGVIRELPARLNLQASVSGSRLDYDAALPLFGEVRQDRPWRVDLELTARDWRLGGFAPRLSIGLAHYDSNLALYDFRRRFAGIGFTREY